MRFSDFKELAQVTIGTILIMAAILSFLYIAGALWRILT